MSVTIKKIAELAGVSIGTVDRVIHNRGEVAPKTEAKIKKILNEVDYQPNVIASSLSSKKETNFGIFMPYPEQDGHYWEFPKKGIKEAAKDLSHYKINLTWYHYDKFSENSFKEKTAKIIQEVGELDGLLMALNLSEAAETFIQEIPEDSPFVLFDSNIPTDKKLTFIGQEPFQSGNLAGKLMNILINGQGTIGIIRILPRDYHLDARIQGFLSFYKNNHNVELKTYEATIHDKDDVISSVTKNIIKDNKDLKGLFVPNARTYEVAEYVANNCYTKKLFVIGYDLIEPNVNYLKNGIIDFALSQRPTRQGYLGIESLFKKVLLKKSVPKKIQIPIDILTKENIDNYCDHL